MVKAMAKLNFLCGLSLCLLFSFAFIEAAPEGSLITNLPGFNGTFPSKHYSGYITFNQKNLFYYFIVSERNPSKNPVVLWLNGGPGCSSFDGFVYENGPFNFEEGNPKGSLPKLHLNPYSWSKVSNIIYLDSPCGVGLSYSKNKTNYKTDDGKTAGDTHFFLLQWFKLYPEFLKNPFYIAGESYAGIYVPTLAAKVVKGIKLGQKPRINFKGYLIGNGIAGSDFEGMNALVPFTHGMGLISDHMYKTAQRTCKGNYNDPQPSNQCFASLQNIDNAVAALNIYNTLTPCYHDPASQQDAKANSTLPISFQQLGVTERPLKVRKRMFGRAWPFWRLGRNGNFPSWSELAAQNIVPCINDEVATIWLNDESVRKAIHAKPKSIAGPWMICTYRIQYDFGSAGSMIPLHKNLTAEGYQALIYSGDHDMCVPFTGSQAWVRSLGYKVVDGWRPWMCNHQVAGYLEGYDHNITFLTIKGAGHTVPEYKPRESLAFYSRWLDGKPI